MIYVICRRAKELESNLEELKKVVFAVEKVKDKEHDIKKTKAKIQDLQRYKKLFIYKCVYCTMNVLCMLPDLIIYW